MAPVIRPGDLGIVSRVTCDSVNLIPCYLEHDCLLLRYCFQLVLVLTGRSEWLENFRTHLVSSCNLRVFGTAPLYRF